MTKDNALEIFPVVEPDGTVIGKATRKECHSGTGLLHPVVHLHVFDTRGRLYLQKRPAWKDIQPDKWDTAVGGHIDFGEELADALRREAREELGLEDFTPIMIDRYVFESERERELVNVFITFTKAEPVPSDELDGGRFWTLTEIESAIGKGIFTPNFESEYRRCRLATTYAEHH